MLNNILESYVDRDKKGSIYDFRSYANNVVEQYLSLPNVKIDKKSHYFSVLLEASRSEEFLPEFKRLSQNLIQHLADSLSLYTVEETIIMLRIIDDSIFSRQQDPEAPSIEYAVHRVEELFDSITKHKSETHLLLSIYLTKTIFMDNREVKLAHREKFQKWIRSQKFLEFLTPENFKPTAFGSKFEDFENLDAVHGFLLSNCAKLATIPELREKVRYIVLKNMEENTANEELARYYQIILSFMEFIENIENEKDLIKISSHEDFFSEDKKWLIRDILDYFKENPIPERILNRSRDIVIDEYDSEKENFLVNLWIATFFFAPRNYSYRLFDTLNHSNKVIPQYSFTFMVETMEGIEQLELTPQQRLQLAVTARFFEETSDQSNFEAIVKPLPVSNILKLLKQNPNVTKQGRELIIKIAEEKIPELGFQQFDEETSLDLKSLNSDPKNLDIDLLEELLYSKTSPVEISLGLLLLFYEEKIPYKYASKIPKLLDKSSAKYQDLLIKGFSEPSFVLRYLNSFTEALKSGEIHLNMDTFYREIEWYTDLLKFKNKNIFFKIMVSRNLLLLPRLFDDNDFHNEEIPEKVAKIIDQSNLWPFFKKNFDDLSEKSQNELYFYYSLLVQISEKAQQNHLRNSDTRNYILKKQEEEHPWAKRVRIRSNEKKSSSASNRTSEKAIQQEPLPEPILMEAEKIQESELETLFKKSDFEGAANFLLQNPSNISNLSYEQVTLILSANKYKAFIEQTILLEKSIPGDDKEFMNAFLLALDDQIVMGLLVEKKQHLLKASALALKLRLKRDLKLLSKVDRMHKNLSLLSKLLLHSQISIPEFSFDILKEFIIDIEYKIPDVLFEYFSKDFLLFILKNPSYTPSQLNFLSKWILKCTDEQQEVLISRILLHLSQLRTEAEMNQMISFIGSSKVSLQTMRRNKMELSHVLEPWVLLYLLEAGLNLPRSSMEMDFSREENEVVLSELKSSSAYFPKVLKNHLSFIKNNPLSNLVSFAHAKPSHTIQKSWSKETFSTKAFEYSVISMQDRDNAYRTGAKEYFDPRGEMEKAAIFETVSFELMREHYVWIVDNKHSLGYDVLSYDPRRNYFYKIEVKSKFSDGYQLSITSNELNQADEAHKYKTEGYYIYLIDLDSLSNPNNKSRFLFRYTGLTTSRVNSIANFVREKNIYLVPRNELSQFLMNTTEP